MTTFLHNIDSPADLKKLPVENLPKLCEEIRNELISVLSETGGHLGGNLGVVELSVALHYVLNSPTDKIVWDVGHQCYVHKLLTGRRRQLNTIRQYKGLAGFAKITESEHDSYGAGHASTAISAAFGLAVSRDMKGEDSQVVAILGDGALTGGLSYEGLNNLGDSGRKMLVILNDNSMSISKNVGAISTYLTEVIADQTYNKAKELIWELTGKLRGGEHIREIVGKIDNSVKNIFVPGIFFEKLGLRYFGPIDGHDVAGLIKILGQLKSLSGPLLLHIRTRKGKGYKPAEDDVCCLHGVSRFDKVTGKSEKSGAITYTDVFGDTAIELAERDKDVVAITAAMATGTGLEKFAHQMPERLFDVGIAEQHAVVFAGGLARGGKKPICAIYSTFLQRAFDPIVHDLSLQNLPVLFAVDRAGLVGDDGPTHHGCFDISYLRLIPGVTICTPRDGTELRQLLNLALDHLDHPIVIRFPRASIPDGELQERPLPEWGTWEKLREGGDGAILAVGSMVTSSLEAAKLAAAKGLDLAVYNCRFIKPLDQNSLKEISTKHQKLITVEEGTLIGGFGSAINDWLCDNDRGDIGLRRLGIPDSFVEHGGRELLLESISLHAEGIAAQVESFVRSEDKHKLVIKSLPTTPTVDRTARVRMAAKEKK